MLGRSAVLGLLAGVLGWAGVARADGFVFLSPEEATIKANNENKVVLFYFTAAWCPPCQVMARDVWPNKQVQAWLAEHAVAVKIDVDKQPTLSAKFKVTSIPTLIVLDPKSGKNERQSGLQTADRLLAMLRPFVHVPAATPVPTAVPLVAMALPNAPTPNADSELLKRMQRAANMVSNGRFREAMREYDLCVRPGVRTDRGFSSIRATTLVTAIHDLARRLPEASSLIDQLRDQSTRAVLSAASDVTPMDVLTVVTIARVRNEPQLILDLHDRVKTVAKLPEDVRLATYFYASDVLLSAGRYADILSQFNVTPEQRDQAFTAMEQAILEAGPAASSASYRDQMTAGLLARLLPVYVSLLATGNDNEAWLIERGLLRVNPTIGMHETLLMWAAAVKGESAVGRVAKSGRAVLRGADAERLEAAIRKAVAAFPTTQPARRLAAPTRTPTPVPMPQIVKPGR